MAACQAEVLRVDPQHPEPGPVARAAEVLRHGGLVAFPTETVYGLGANALDPQAVARIFAAKGRPPTNPVIVHVADTAAARQLASEWTLAAQRLAERFWPGPLSLVLPRAECIPDIVTAGGRTVALRVPSLPLTRALLAAAAVPIAAPSANLSTRISATTAEHVRQTLHDRLELILDGGPTPGGLESTVVDATSNPPRLLRPGLIGLEALSSAVGRQVVVATGEGDPDEPARSPGLQRRHYAPGVPLECTEDDGWPRVEQLLSDGLLVGWIPLIAEAEQFVAPARANPRLASIALPAEPAAYARQIYAALHGLEAAGVEHIVVQRPPRGEAWRTIHDRLARAAVAPEEPPTAAG